jgi:hypothetical protein
LGLHARRAWAARFMVIPRRDGIVRFDELHDDGYDWVQVLVNSSISILSGIFWEDVLIPLHTLLLRVTG